MNSLVNRTEFKMLRTYHKRFAVAFVLLALLLPHYSYGLSKQDMDFSGNIPRINNLFKENGIRNGFVELDAEGKVILKGEYRDEKEVDRAFSLAQSIAGVKRVAAVDRQIAKVKGMEGEESAPELLRGAAVKPKKASTSVKVTPPGPIKNKFALIIGVGEFKNRITPLEYAANDAMNVYNYLTDQERGAFPKGNVFLLINKDATKSNITKYFNKIKSEAKPDDLVFIYISSHGTPPDKFGGVYIVTYESEVKPREKIWNTSLSEKMLRDFIDNVKSKRLTIVLDACYSNGAYKHIAGFTPPGGKSLDEEEVFGISRDFAKRLIGAKDIVDEDTAAISETGWGRVLIGASSAGEKSWESQNLQSSIFTFYFLDGLSRHDGALKDAYDYAKPLVSQKVKEEKGQDIEQNSQVLATTKQWNFHVVGSPSQTASVSQGNIQQQQERPKDDFDVKLWTDRKTYREGEKIKIYMRGNKPFYGKLLYKNADGNILQLLPNPYRKDTFFWSGVDYEIPSRSDRFELEVEPPFGKEQITVYASPSLLGELYLESQGGVYQVRSAEKDIPVLVRGVRIKEKTTQKKDTMASKDPEPVSLEKTSSYLEKSVSIETKKR